MVTLRRDVAAINRNETFDRRSDGLLTEYDRFMLAKKQAEAERAACDYGFCSARGSEGKRFVPSGNGGKIDINYFGLPKEESLESKKQSTGNKPRYSSYDEYMEAQLKRAAPGKILSKSEFAEEYGKVSASVTAKEGVKRVLSKKAKIFVAAYVLIVGIMASVIMLVDTNASATEDVAAAPESGYTAQGELNSLSEVVVYAEAAK